MATYKQVSRPKASQPQLAVGLDALQSRDVQDSLEKLRRKYGRYAVSAERLRDMLDKALGERTLTQELCALRDE